MQWMFHSKLSFQILLWKSNGWLRKRLWLPSFFLTNSPPPHLSLSLSSLVPTGGHQPHDSVSLPVGPFINSSSLHFLLLFLSCSLSSNTFSACIWRAVTCRRQKNLLKKWLQKLVFRDTFRFWPDKTVHSVAMDDFGHLRFHFRRCSIISLIFIAHSGHAFNNFSVSKYSLLLLLLPQHPSSYRQWLTGQQQHHTMAPACCWKKDLDFLNNLI